MMIVNIKIKSMRIWNLEVKYQINQTPVSTYFPDRSPGQYHGRWWA